ncbi:uncharacterized protein I206_107382 [Kwoniella pini CBS 10737]|uniref:Peptidyl-prolyl cis-trans isomerase n=1 Tax=Kwoniella pini CBS 10737 TaxID=1296096 RepID=A0A1B9HX64_9TREE|nr:peptidyl-prolyl cis-trans isomerase [Kwoniella pini CBS 10737]OCF47848.1 peptidyl-prolyl cis-trans isomerase [Kwoniella pini CBS 10737]
MSDKLPNVFFTIAINGKELGKIEFKLYDDITPKTSSNFRSLCVGKKPDNTNLPKGFGFKNTLFHRIIPEFMIQGGDFERGDGTGGQSIFGDKFPDENFEKKHDSPNSNGSQFFITTIKSCPWLDGKHTVFGEVANESSLKIVKEIESKGTREGKPKEKVIIVNCGAV